MNVGERIFKLRKALNLTQERFSERLKVSKGFLSNLEKGIRCPSDQLLRLISYEYSSSENWLKTGEGEMFLFPEEVLKKQMANFGESAIIEAFTNIMKERGLAVANGRPGHHAGPVLSTGDPSLDGMISTLLDLWAAGDDKLKAWAEVQFYIAIPKHIVEEVQKKQKEIHGQSSAG